MEQGKALNLAGRLMRLAASTDNEHEADTARRQARKLLDAHKITRIYVVNVKPIEA